MRSLALIPARSGSKRVIDKNIYPINDHPLLAYAIRSALDSHLFDDIYVCTDSQHYAEIAIKYGAKCPSLRPADNSQSSSPDASWIEWFFSVNPSCISYDYAAILRPTSPFRKPHTIIRAFDIFLSSGADTLRAVRPVSEHPGKMWVFQCNHIVPLIPLSLSHVPFHSNQTCELFTCYVQDASLEIFTVSNFLSTHSITGSSVLPFFNVGHEGFDINTMQDVQLMHQLIDANIASPYDFVL